jgi:hypothetical protein
VWGTPQGNITSTSEFKYEMCRWRLWLREIRDEAVTTYFNVLSIHLLERPEENQKIP